jgi:REP element-mobilizing transposase RayT
MPRPLRIEYPGAAYHVMARGNQGRAIFEDDKDRQRFLETLGEACEKTGWRVHAYVLMGNHYHLLVETPEANLVAGMKWLQGTYTQRYNRRHEVFGHLFQGRYKAVPVEAARAGCWEVVSTYIHLNPARAGLIKAGKERLRRYRWSSYPWYVAAAGKGPQWLERERVMGSLGLAPEDRRGYEACLERRVLEIGMQAGRGGLEEQWRQMRRGWYVGGEGFFGELRERLEKAVRGRRRESHSGAARRAHDELAAEKMLQTGLKALGLRMEALQRMRKGAPEKLALAGWIRERTTASLRWVTQRLRMGHSGNASQGARKLNRAGAQKLKRLKSVLEQIRGREQ